MMGLGGFEISNSCYGHQRDGKRAKQAARDLAALMSDKLDARIDAIALRLFLRAYWSRVEVLAHTIHDNEEE